MTYNGNLLAYAGDGAGEAFSNLFVPLLLACVIDTLALYVQNVHISCPAGLGVQCPYVSCLMGVPYPCCELFVQGMIKLYGWQLSFGDSVAVLYDVAYP